MARSLALLAPLFLSSGCAWLFGHGELPQPRDPVRPVPAQARATAGPLAMEATWLGVGERIVTARNVWGRAARMVNPFGADTYRVRITLRATGPEPVVILPERATLADDAGHERPARTLADYRARWPGWAAVSDAEDADRRAAYEHLLGVVLIAREVGSAEDVVGEIGFPAFPPVRKLTLRLPYERGFKPGAVTATWEGL